MTFPEICTEMRRWPLARPFLLDDDVDGGGDLPPHRRERDVGAHEDHGFQTRDGILGGVGVDGGHGTGVAGVHGLKHIDGLIAAAFADDDAVGPHAQGVFHQIARDVAALALGIGGFGFQQRNDVFLLHAR